MSGSQINTGVVSNDQFNEDGFNSVAYQIGSFSNGMPLSPSGSNESPNATFMSMNNQFSNERPSTNQSKVNQISKQNV